MTRPLLILDCGPVPQAMQALGSFDHYFRQAANYGALALQSLEAQHQALPPWEDLAGVIVSGSLSMVTDRENWSLRLADWLAQALKADLPILGVCYGHQLIAQALGGTVDYNPKGLELGLHQVRLRPGLRHPLLEGIPQSFPAPMVHSQSVIQPPREAQVLASSSADACQILGYGPRSLSLQFHPEFNGQIMQAFLDAHRAHPKALVGEEGQDCPAAQAILQNFVNSLS